jgi:hydrogenase 3 maturation protease
VRPPDCLAFDEGLDKFLPIGDPSPRVAVLGIGNELTGDDGVGVRVARDLSARLGPRAECLVLEAGTAPENFTGVVRRFRPDLVLLVDAAHLGVEPGSVYWLDWEHTDGLSSSTHTLPPSVFGRFLVEEFACRLALLVIQPAHLEFDRPLSPPVAAAAERVVDGLLAALGRPSSGQGPARP